MSQAEDSHQDISGSKKEAISSKYKSIIRSQDSSNPEGKTLYIVLNHESFTSVNAVLQNMSHHFDNTSVILLKIENHISEIEEAIKKCIASRLHTMCILSDDTSFHKDILTYYDFAKEPSNLGNCSSDGREVWRETQGFLIDPDKLLYLSNVIQFGLQLQLTPMKFFDAMDKEFFEYYRVGYFKRELEEVEPIMRDLNIFQLSCNTIRHSDFKAKFDFNPSGFFAEEALQLVKYASLSPYLSFILIRDIHPDKLDQPSIELLSQLIWYTTHGVDVRLEDSPYELENMQEYIVDHDYYDFPISFLKSKKSGRWWIKIPNHHEDRAPFVCISCSEKDYMEVFENRIPGRLIRAIERNQ